MCRFLNALDLCKTKQDLARLTAVWDRTFLNYTEAFPDQWHDPDEEFSEDLQRPEYAIPYFKKLTDLEDPDRSMDRIQTYFEYFAAVWRIRFSTSQLRIALPFLETIAQQQKANPYFKKLSEAVKETLSDPAASADPHKHTQYLSGD